ncbi:MAG: ornithine--oxo-acid transaminase [Pseudomonadota bacterium]
MKDSKSLIQAEAELSAQYYQPIPVVLSQAKGVWAWDVEGNRYLDMLAAYSAASHGHGHPRLLQALRDQSEKLCVPSRAFYSDKLPAFLKTICTLTGLDKVAPMNTGAEAVETGIKAARLWGYRIKGIPKDRAEIIVANNNFHGRTTTIISFSSNEKSYDGFGPLTPGFKQIPFGDIQALQEAITPNTCAILFEPIQGEGGVIVPPQGWLPQVAQLCHENNVLLLLDEIQSGLGRTGKMFACRHENVQPDGIMLGKALGGGMLPISAFVAREEIMQQFTPSMHGSTYGGNPLACAVGLEALKILQDEELIENSAELGAYMLGRLHALAHSSSVITEVRGQGLWAGVDINPEVMSGHDMADLLMKHGVLTKETRHQTLRFSPPLVITRKELDWGLDRFEEIVAQIG